MRARPAAHACPRCLLPVVFITAEFKNARNESRHRVEARHFKTLTPAEGRVRLGTSDITPKYAGELLRELARTCKMRAV
jgi:hypothetical protein